MAKRCTDLSCIDCLVGLNVDKLTVEEITAIVGESTPGDGIDITSLRAALADVAIEFDSALKPQSDKVKKLGKAFVKYRPISLDYWLSF